MNKVIHRTGYAIVERNSVGRIGDYSRESALFVGLYNKKDDNGGDFKRVSVYSMIDIPNKDTSPHPKFTSRGGCSQEVLAHLRHIFYVYRPNENTKKVTFFDETGNTMLALYLAQSGDITVGVENRLGEPAGIAASFKEGRILYQGLVILKVLIENENKKNSERNPLTHTSFRERLTSVNMFP